MKSQFVKNMKAQFFSAYNYSASARFDVLTVMFYIYIYIYRERERERVHKMSFIFVISLYLTIFSQSARS
jgi:hypothetical protein